MAWISVRPGAALVAGERINHEGPSWVQRALSWTGGRPPYTVQYAGQFASPQWTALVVTNGTTLITPAPAGRRFYRVVN